MPIWPTVDLYNLVYTMRNEREMEFLQSMMTLLYWLIFSCVNVNIADMTVK